MSPSLLAHIVKGYASNQWENIATDSLLYLLERPGVEDAFMRVVHGWGVIGSDLQWSTQVTNEDRSRPDLVGRDSLGRPAVMIEVKFWATLTDNQPLAYLRSQELAFPGEAKKRLLVFLVPRTRFSALTAELARRLEADEEVSARVRDGESILDANRLGVITWADLLKEIRSELMSRDDVAGLEDLNQLTGLCDRADSESMRPITAAEIDRVHGQRYGDYVMVAQQAAERLIHEARVDSRGLRSSDGSWGVGRFLRSLDGVGFWFGFYPDYWSRHHSTPWWIQFNSYERAEVHQSLRQLAKDSRFPFIGSDGSMTVVAVPAPLGVEFDDVVRQVADFVVELLEAVSGLLPEG